MPDGALDLVLMADGALVEAARHPAVRKRLRLAYRRRELGMDGDPVVDGARGNAEETAKVFVGGAQQAVVAGELAVISTVQGGTAGFIHGRNITQVIDEV